MTILVVSHPGDDHLEPVVGALRRLGHEPAVFDMSTYPTATAIALSYADGDGDPLWLELPDGRMLDLSRCRSAWWRRPMPFTIDPAITDPGNASWAYNECHEAISGLWSALDVTWVNSPQATEAAMMKSWQLRVASAVGLEIPRTLITNSQREAKDFVHAIGVDRTVYKAFSATIENWRETRLLRSSELAQLEAVQYAPVIFQEYVPASVDLRVTLIGDEVYPAAIHSQELEYTVDFRMHLDEVRMEPTTLPGSLVAALYRLLARMDLRYGAVDMRRTPDGRYVFLEINPAGQWRFVEEKTAQPMTNAMARLLATPED
jgi:MvdD pre-ATP grasp domain